MPHISRASLRDSLHALGDLSAQSLIARHGTVALVDIVRGSSLNAPVEELRGRSILIATRDQLATALALFELDGIARRMILCPYDLDRKHLPFVMESAEVDAVISDGSAGVPDHPAVRHRLSCSPRIVYGRVPGSSHQTEWILLTSGTTGLPKLVAHALDSLTGAVRCAAESDETVVWGTFYDIRRYGGLQIFLRAVLSGASLVLSDERESTSEFLMRASTNGVTHISGTPSHWRRALMSPAASVLNPRYVRLSGEIADQGILDNLLLSYPQARVSHAFASTEAGVAFDVDDGQAGFPASFIAKSSGVDMKVEDGSLRIRSSRVASRYLGPNSRPLRDEDGFVDSGDMVALDGDRYYFAGRRDGVINVGGLKVHPEEVDALVNHHPGVRMSLVHARKNPVTGALIVAEVVLREASASEGNDIAELKNEILLYCRKALPAHKVPAIVNFVPTLGVADTGKLMRFHA